MNTIDAILQRRSVRKYKSDPILDEHLNTLLKAAMYAPSARNTQPWEFIVVKDKTKMNAIADANPYAKMIKDAPLAIVVCGDTSKEAFPGFWIQDCSAATQNILLAAYDLNIGTVWTGVHPKAERVEPIKEIFNIPEHIIPLCVIVLGYIDSELPSVDRYDASKIKFDTY